MKARKKMYLIALDSKNMNYCGSDWTQKINYKSRYHIKKRAENMIKFNNKIESIYILPFWSQKLSGMEPIIFSQYITRNCMKII